MPQNKLDLAELRRQLNEWPTVAWRYQTRTNPLSIDECTQLLAIAEAAQEFIEAMETCHICKAVLVIDEPPAHCEDCSGDCDDHEPPDCAPTDALFRALRKALES